MAPELILLTLFLATSTTSGEEEALFDFDGSYNRRDCSGQQTVICEGSKGVISCPSGQVRITSAYYGRSDGGTCPHDSIYTRSCFADRKFYLQTLCDGKSSCTVDSLNKFGDPCQGTYKYTDVCYQCRKAPALKVSQVCENDFGSLSCANGNIKVISAFYGRLDDTTCVRYSVMTTACFSDRLSYVKSQCDGKRSCTFDSTNQFGDPCFLTYKYTEIKYQCV